MKESGLQDSSIMNFEFQIAEREESHFHQDIEVLYVLEGKIKITVGNDVYDANADDVIIMNANKKHSYQSSGDILIGYFHINFQKLSAILNTNQILFWCNSIVDKNEAYDELRNIIKKIFNQYFERNEQAGVYITSLYFQLLHILISNFLVKTDDKRFADAKDVEEERVAEIVNYIQANYARSISLNELAENLYLSIPYLSKYIKKKLGSSFIDYVNNIRLFHAIDDLLYTDKSIMYISLENGFANAASFNSVFKKNYQMNPSEYRLKMKQKENEQRVNEKQEKKEKVLQKVVRFLENNITEKIEDSASNEKYTIMDVQERVELKRHWNEMINIGKASDLLRFDVQNHVLILKKELGFQYVRFWGIFSEELFIDENNSTSSYNFDNMDKILDFLVENNIYPYIEMGYKPQKLYRTVDKAIINNQNKIGFQSYESLQRFMSSFSSHLINRYGIEEVEHWYFEQWKDENITQESDKYFFEVFECIYKTMKIISPNIKVGGAGIGIQFGKGNLTKLIHNWEKRECKPDFISLYCYPYITGEENGDQYAKVSTDRCFLKNQLSMAREVIKDSKLKDVEIHITEWSSTISNRNNLNDSCFKGAYIMKNLIDTIGEVAVLGYWLGTDIFSEYYDSHVLLNGGCGLLNKDGVKKPAFYAYDFMNQLKKYLICVDENSIVTANDHNNFAIACHNYRHLNYKYYLRQEDDISIEKQHQMFEDNEEIRINYQFKNIKNGSYQVKIFSVNKINGSVQDEWKRMELNQQLTKQEADYLKRICIPRIFMKTCTVKDGVLNLETRLSSQEIQYIYIRYLYA